MRPQNLHPKIFLDSGNPEDTRRIKALMGFLDGQTTNPTLISKHPVVQERVAAGQLFTADEALGLYKNIVQQISAEMPHGAISIEVYADETTTKEEMLTQADEFCTWITHPHIKFPITPAGLAAVEQAVVDGMNVNLTLCFSQEQAAAVYAATRGAKPGQVFLSPFIGRLDDVGYDGVDVVKHIINMFENSDQHVQVLAASIRNLAHLIRSIEFGADCLTVPFNVLSEWAAASYPVTSVDTTASEPQSLLHPIEFSEIDLNKPWQEYNIAHELTSKGLQKFVSDWQSLVQQ
ncbi:MAG: transaldolase family protein [Patescibacteria group bacterium]